MLFILQVLGIYLLIKALEVAIWLWVSMYREKKKEEQQ